MGYPPGPGPDRRPTRRLARGADRGPRRLADSLEAAVAGLSPPPGRPSSSSGVPPPGVLGTVFSRWEEIVGPALSRHVRPLTLAGGVLAVAVDRPAWATQVRALGASLLERVGEVSGEAPRELRVVVRPAAA